MASRASRVLIVISAISLFSSVACTSAFATEEFHSFILPEDAFVEIGAEVTLSFEVDTTAHHFNGYEVTIEFPPDLLEFLRIEEGSLMIAACPNRFRADRSTDSTVTYAHILLCAGLSIDGPGELSRYVFRALTPGAGPVTMHSHPDFTFFDAGEYVNPDHPTYPRQVVPHDARVHVYDPALDVGEGGHAGSTAAAALVARPVPHPVPATGGRLEVTARGLDIVGHPAGVQVDVWTVDGRLVSGLATLDSSVLGDDRTGPGPISFAVHWPPGVYLYRVRSSTGSVTGKLIVSP